MLCCCGLRWARRCGSTLKVLASVGMSTDMHPARSTLATRIVLRKIFMGISQVELRDELAKLSFGREQSTRPCIEYGMPRRSTVAIDIERRRLQIQHDIPTPVGDVLGDDRTGAERRTAGQKLCAIAPRGERLLIRFEEIASDTGVLDDAD